MPRLWLFEETIDTDVLAPGFYMKSPLAELAEHCLEAVRPEFVSKVQKGDVILAGDNMGVGSSREQAAEVLKYHGIAAVIARSFAGIFYRNSINLGLPALILPKGLTLPDECVDGAEVSFQFDKSMLTLTKSQKVIGCEPIPTFLKTMIDDGGLVPHLEKRFSAEVITKC